jgi:hypothetical protein
VTTFVLGWFVAQSFRMTISDYIAALVARAGVRNAPCVGAQERAVSDCCEKSPQYNANDSSQIVLS